MQHIIKLDRRAWQHEKEESERRKKTVPGLRPATASYVVQAARSPGPPRRAALKTVPPPPAPLSSSPTETVIC